MSDTPEQNIQVDEAQAQVGGPDVASLLNQIELLKANNSKLLTEKKNTLASHEDLQKQLRDLQNNQTKAKQQALQDQGEYKQLWQDQSKTVSELQEQISSLTQQLDAKEAAFQQAQIKSTVMNAFTQNGVHAPEHLYQLMKDNLRIKDGSVVALHGGVEVDIASHLQNLKSPGSGFDFYFQGTQARGMGVVGSSTSTATGGQENPYLPGGSFMAKVQLEASDPELAARLKAQAKAA